MTLLITVIVLSILAYLWIGLVTVFLYEKFQYSVDFKIPAVVFWPLGLLYDVLDISARAATTVLFKYINRRIVERNQKYQKASTVTLKAGDIVKVFYGDQWGDTKVTYTIVSDSIENLPEGVTGFYRVSLNEVPEHLKDKLLKLQQEVLRKDN